MPPAQGQDKLQTCHHIAANVNGSKHVSMDTDAGNKGLGTRLCKTGTILIAEQAGKCADLLCRLTNVPGPWLQITEAANSKWYRLEKIDLLAQVEDNCDQQSSPACTTVCNLCKQGCSYARRHSRATTRRDASGCATTHTYYAAAHMLQCSMHALLHTQMQLAL